MGVSLQRAGFAALLLAGLLLPLRGPPAETRMDLRADRGVRLRELSQDMRTARLRWSALTARDSALALLRRTGTATPGPTVHYSGFPAGARAEEAEATLAKLWKKIGSVDSSVAVAMLIYNEAGFKTETSWGLFSGNLITERDGITWCLAIVPGGLNADSRMRVWKETLDRAIAPCAILAAFGPPGESVRSWLDATRYTAVRSNGWLTHPAEFLEGQGAGPWQRLLDDRMEYYRSRFDGFSLARSLAWLQIPTLLSPPYHYGAPGVRCMHGDRAACNEAILHSALTTAEDAVVPRDLTVSATPLRTRNVTLATPRPPAEFLLSDLIRSQGREKFGAFWKSERPFESAFQLAFGESLGAWTARWARRQWLASWEAKERSSSLILGANLALSWPLLVLGWTGLALAAVAWAASRKQVT